MRYSLICALVCNLLMIAPLRADAPATQPANDHMMIMSYDVGDLLRATDDYPLSESAIQINNNENQGGNPGRPGQPQILGPGNAPGAQLTGESIIMLVKQMMPQDDLTVSLFGNLLIVRASDDTHTKVRSMLESMHSSQGPTSMVCTRVFWISLTPQEVASVFEKVKASKEGAVAPMPQLPDALSDASHLYCQAQTICFSGQTVHVVSGRSQSYISSETPVVGSSSVGYAPQISNALSGVTVQLRPQLLENGLAMIDVASMVNETGAEMKKVTINAQSLSESPTSQPVQHADGVIESPNVVQQEFHTTVRVSTGKKILVGGMTLEPAAKDQAGRQLFLAIEVDAVE